MLTRLLISLLSLLLVFEAAFGKEKENVHQKTSERAVEKVVAERDETETLKNAMLEAIRRHKGTDRWSGVTEQQIFGISVVAFTDRDVRDGDMRMFRKTAQLLASKEMLLAKVLLDKYAETGLNDSGTLRQAALEANESISVQTTALMQTDNTVIEGKRIIGIAVADRNLTLTSMTSSKRIDAVRTAYQNIVHRQAKQLTAQKKYDEALRRLLELRQAKLLGREQLFDVLNCFVAQNKPVDAEKIIDHLLMEHVDDLALYRRLVSLVSKNENKAFRKITQKLQMEIDRLDPPEMSAEQAFQKILDEISD